MRYVVDLRHSLQALAVLGALTNLLFLHFVLRIDPVVEAVGMWESRRDFQRVWEGWEANVDLSAIECKVLPARHILFKT